MNVPYRICKKTNTKKDRLQASIIMIEHDIEPKLFEPHL